MARRYSYVYSMEGLGGLWISLAILVIETLLLIQNTDLIRFQNLEDLIVNKTKLCILISYFMSVIAIPGFIAWRSTASAELAQIQRVYVPKHLIPIKIRNLRKKLSYILMLVPLSSLFIVLGIAYNQPILFLFTLTPVIALVALMIKPMLSVYEHRKQIEAELPWFIVLLYIAESVNAGIGFLLKKLRKSRILPAIAKELDVIDRDAKLYFPSHIDAMIHRASVTPSERFGRLLAGYASRIRSGADVISWLRAKLNEELIRAEFSFRLFAERTASLIGQLALAIYAIIPLILVALANFIDRTTMLVLPITATPLMIALAYTIRPKMLDEVSLKPLLPSVAALIVVSMLLHDMLGGLAIAIGWALAIAINVGLIKTLREIEVLKRDSIDIIREVLELRRSGYSITSALRYIASRATYSSLTIKRLREVVHLVDMGVPLSEISSLCRTPSYLFKFSIFSLGLMQESGGGTLEALQALYESMKRVLALEENVKKISWFFDGFAISNALVLVWISKTLNTMNMFKNMALQLLNVIVVETQPPPLDTLVLISMLGYSMISTILRRGYLAFELKHIIFLAVGILISILIQL